MEALNKKEKIRQVMKLLEQGKTVYINSGYGYLWLGRCRVSGKTLIYWHNFGQSANRKNLKELAWILNTIFDCKYKNFNYFVR